MSLALLQKLTPCLLLALFAFGAAWTAQAWRYDGKLAAMEARHAKAQAAAVALQRAVDLSRYEKLQEVANDAEAKRNQAESDLAAQRDLAKRLHDHVASLQAAAGAGAATAASAGADLGAHDAGRMLADLRAEFERRAFALAGYADRLKLAGEACEASYRAVINAKP